MSRRLLRAAGWAMGSLAFICTAALALLRFLPGDPARMILGPLASQQAVESFRASERMDAPWWVQYGLMLQRLAHGDLGQSYVQRRPVLEIIAEHTPTTLGLVGVALLWMLLLGFCAPVALHALGMTRGRRLYLGGMTALGASPPFATAVFLAAIFSGFLGWMSAVFSPTSLASWVLPSLALAAYPAALTALLCDGALERAMGSGYVRAARSRGGTHAAVVLGDALPNAWRPTVGAMANGVASFVTGTLGVEVVFSIPGLGGITYQAIRSNDFPLMAGTITVFGAVMALMTATLRLLVETSRERA